MPTPGHETQRLTIVWDVDDVLNDLMRNWFEWWRTDASGRPDLTYDDLTANPPHELLGIPRDAYLASLDAYRLSEEARAQPPLPEVLAWFEAHGKRYRHVALTATPLATAPVSAEWVVRWFGYWIRTFHFVPSPRDDDGLTSRETKEEFLGWLGRADVIVDDLSANIEAAGRVGLDAVTVPRPWNGGKGSVADALATLDDILTRKERDRG